MKLFKRLFSAVAVLALVGASASCAGESEKTLTAYGIVHGEYVGEATVVVKGDEVISVVIDEAFLPSAWAATKDSADTVNVFTLTAGTTTLQWAKYVNIDGVVWTAQQYSVEERTTDKVSTRAALAVKYTRAGESNHLLNYLKNEANAKAYYQAIKEDKFFASDVNGNRLNNFTYTSTNGKFKSEGKYWAQSATVVLGWKGNMEALTSAIVANGFATAPTKVGDAKVVSFGDAVTAVTMTDYIQYFDLAKLAYNKK